jgi:hypothetical protein
MTNLPEVADWVAGIYQIEQTDPVLGGPPNIETGAGIANVQAQQLADRTAWLKAQIAAAVAFVITTGTGLSGGGPIDGGLTLSADLADQAVAEAGSNNLQLMTALRTKQAIDVAIEALVGAAPAQLDTLNELAVAIAENGDTSAAMTALIGTKLNSANYTAADVLTKLLTVDGVGSGLDADKLGGNGPAFFRNAGNLNAGIVALAHLPIAAHWQASEGIDHATLMTPLRVAQAIAALKGPDYDSGWVAGWSAPFTALHGLASTPMRYQWTVKCHTATSGFNVGDVIMVLPHADGDGARVKSSWANATELTMRYVPNGAGRTTALMGYAPSNFDLRVLAWSE